MNERTKMSYRKRWIALLLSSFAIVLTYLLFFYSPYSMKRISKNWELAKNCDNEALYYLADYYEKRNEIVQYREVIQMGAGCQKQWAIDLLNYLPPIEKSAK